MACSIMQREALAWLQRGDTTLWTKLSWISSEQPTLLDMFNTEPRSDKASSLLNENHHRSCYSRIYSIHLKATDP